MAGVDPYASCPCGSGQKFKWCCQKMEAYADRAQRLHETGQSEAAIDVLNEGLRKEPANSWLLVRKALIQTRDQRPEEAKHTLRELIKRQPLHVTARALLIRCVLETDGPRAGIDEAQAALAAVSEKDRPGLGSMLAIIGALLGRIGWYQSAVAHLRLARTLSNTSERDGDLSSIENSVLSKEGLLPWLKTSYRLSPTPSDLNSEPSRRFAEALAWAEAGLWSSAASAFELLSATMKGPEADRNLGLCRLWLADSGAAAAALRRAIKKMGVTDDAVDLEALCQLIAPTEDDDKIEHVQLIWPLRNRDALLSTLRAETNAADEGIGPIDPDDPDSPEVEQFALLDRPRLEEGRGSPLTVDDVPRIVGRVSIGQEIAALEGDDDGRLDALSARFTALAGSSIAPAHPKTKVLGETSRVQAALTWEWYPPEWIGSAESRRLIDEQQSRLIDQVWTRTPLPYLGGRTPRQAASAGDAVVPLRAACCQFDRHMDGSVAPVDMAAFRASLGIGPEPEIDPATVDVATLPLPRFFHVPVERLDDETLIAFLDAAREAALGVPIERAARAVIARPALFASGRIAAYPVYRVLVHEAIDRDDADEAFRLIEQGRRAADKVERSGHPVTWDMLEITVRARCEEPESWVPELAVVLERYRDDPDSSQSTLLGLIEMGLLRMVPNPETPGDVMLDPRPLQALMSQYGPRVTTASGQLGIAATKPGIWTPGGESAGASRGIWTPGSAPAPPAGGDPDKPKLIIPGR